MPALAVVIAAAGCLPIDEDDGFEPMCVSTSDCDAGEACEEGICWGNPPATPFAAQLLPPGEDDQGLATTEIPALEIGPDGWVANLAFAPSATIRGRVTLACDQSPANPGCDPATTIAATIFASRKSAIPGQPLYTRTVTSRLGAIDDEISFSLSLPVSEEPYEIIITPVTPDENTSASELLPVQLAPPSRLTLQIDGADTMESEAWVVGQSANYMVLEGEVLDSLENPMPGMKVKAEMPGASARRVSSLAFTDDQGHFSLRILRDLGIDEVEIIAEPRDGMNVPTVRVRHVAISEAVPLEPLVIELPSFGDPVPYSLPIEGADGSGGTEPIAGATVRAITFFTEPDAPVVSTYSTSTVTDQDGQAQLMLIPGKRLENRTYNIIVEPPRESPHAARFDVTTTIGSADGGTLEAIDLDRRVAISGLVKEADGSDANGASIEIRLSRPFVDSLDPSLRALVDNIALPKVTTSANGRFVFYLDRRLAGIPTLYDIVIRSGRPARRMAIDRWGRYRRARGRRDRAGRGPHPRRVICPRPHPESQRGPRARGPAALAGDRSRLPVRGAHDRVRPAARSRRPDQPGRGRPGHLDPAHTVRAR